MRLIDSLMNKINKDTVLGKMVRTMIEIEPTAYDVDKVMKQLEVNSMYVDENIESYIMFDDAIEIVKSGGIE